MPDHIVARSQRGGGGGTGKRARVSFPKSHFDWQQTDFYFFICRTANRTNEQLSLRAVLVSVARILASFRCFLSFFLALLLRFLFPPPLPCPAPLPPQLGAITAREKRNPKGVAEIPLCTTKSRVIPLCTVWLNFQRGGTQRTFLCVRSLSPAPQEPAQFLCVGFVFSPRGARGAWRHKRKAAAPGSATKLRRIPCPTRSYVDFGTFAEIVLAAGQPHGRPCVPARATAFCCRDARCCQRMNKLKLHGGLDGPNHRATSVCSGAWDLVAADSVATPCFSTAS